MARSVPLSPHRFLFVVLLAMTGASIVFGVLGYLIGSDSSAGLFAPEHQRFIRGVAAGVEIRIEFEEWESEKGKFGTDVRSEPLTRCAGRFFQDPIKLAGCAQGLKEPSAGYQMPR